MTGSYPSVVVRVTAAIVAPFIFMFGIYIIIHGHYGPGGGFAGGVYAAVGVVLPRLALDESVSYRIIPASVGPVAGALGLVIFLSAAIAPMLFGASFLDYGALENALMDAPRARYLGILVVEIGVGITVFGAMVMIFDALTGKELAA
ncbi:MAG: MnhB domain-containing protein [Nitriliruptoraceae bacterium]